MEFHDNLMVNIYYSKYMNAVWSCSRLFKSLCTGQICSATNIVCYLFAFYHDGKYSPVELHRLIIPVGILRYMYIYAYIHTDKPIGLST